MGELPYPACRVTYHKTVLHCDRLRSSVDNLRACMVALAYLTGIPIAELQADPDLRVDYYRSY